MQVCGGGLCDPGMLTGLITLSSVLGARRWHLDRHLTFLFILFLLLLVLSVLLLFSFIFVFPVVETCICPFVHLPIFIFC